MMMVLEVAGEATPTRSRPERHPNSNPSYIISACLVSLHLTVTNHRRLLESGVGRTGAFIVIVMVCSGSVDTHIPPSIYPLPLSSGSGAGCG